MALPLRYVFLHNVFRSCRARNQRPVSFAARPKGIELRTLSWTWMSKGKVGPSVERLIMMDITMARPVRSASIIVASVSLKMLLVNSRRFEYLSEIGPRSWWTTDKVSKANSSPRSPWRRFIKDHGYTAWSIWRGRRLFLHRSEKEFPIICRSVNIFRHETFCISHRFLWPCVASYYRSRLPRLSGNGHEKHRIATRALPTWPNRSLLVYFSIMGVMCVHIFVTC